MYLINLFINLFNLLMNEWIVCVVLLLKEESVAIIIDRVIK